MLDIMISFDKDIHAWGLLHIAEQSHPGDSGKEHKQKCVLAKLKAVKMCPSRRLVTILAAELVPASIPVSRTLEATKTSILASLLWQ